MQPEFYTEMASVEDKHFWFVARRRLIGKVLDHMKLASHSDILEIGCGSGGNLDLLARYGNLYAVELDRGARALANRRNIVKVEEGSLPDNVPFADRHFDIIAMLDVLEHIADDVAALRTVHERLKDNGIILLTVPAYQFLWSHHDVVSHHRRRYVRGELERLIANVGFTVVYSTYFNTILFPIVATVRFLKNIFMKDEKSDVQMPPKVVNALLTRIFAAECLVVPKISLPYGVSVLIVGCKGIAMR